MTTQAEPNKGAETNSNGSLRLDQVKDSQSLNALFSYFRTWSPTDATLTFKDDSVLKVA